MDYNNPIVTLFFIAAYSVISLIAEDRLKEVYSTLDDDNKRLAQFVYKEKRKKYHTTNIIFTLLYFLALKYTAEYYVWVGLIVFIYSYGERTTYIREMNKEILEMNFPNVFLKRINRTNRLYYLSSFLIGIVAMHFSAYYHYS